MKTRSWGWEGLDSWSLDETLNFRCVALFLFSRCVSYHAAYLLLHVSCPCLSVMLSSRPALCLSLSSLGFNSKHGYPFRALSVSPPLSLLLQLLALQCWLVAERNRQESKDEARSQRTEEGTEDERRRRRRADPFQLCFWSKRRRENFFTLKNFPLDCEGTNIFTVYFYPAVSKTLQLVAFDRRGVTLDI